MALVLSLAYINGGGGGGVQGVRMEGVLGGSRMSITLYTEEAYEAVDRY